MGEWLGRRKGFTTETGQAFRILTKGFRQDLQGNLTLESGILSKVHLSHAALAKLTDDLIVAY